MEEDGMGTVEIVLIVVVLVGLVVAFKSGMDGIIGDVIDKVKNDAGGVADIKIK
jgi:hypothetical protein